MKSPKTLWLFNVKPSCVPFLRLAAVLTSVAACRPAICMAPFTRSKAWATMFHARRASKAGRRGTGWRARRYAAQLTMKRMCRASSCMIWSKRAIRSSWKYSVRRPMSKRPNAKKESRHSP